MLDLGMFASGTVRGAALAQIGTSIAMAGVMFGLILHFQYAYGWSPMRAGLANLPLILTMIAATPISESLAHRFGHRAACHFKDRVARHAPIRVTAIEKKLKTRYTVDTLTKLPRLYPKHRFIWLMGADNLAQFNRWEGWRRIAGQVPIAVIARPGYDARAHASPAMGWLRRFVRPADQAKSWTMWRLPALVLLRFRPDPTSATRLRAADPDWQTRFLPPPTRAQRPS